jgi:hypothetical protein
MKLTKMDSRSRKFEFHFAGLQSCSELFEAASLEDKLCSVLKTELLRSSGGCECFYK